MCDGEKVRHAWIYGGMCEIRPPVYNKISPLIKDLGYVRACALDNSFKEPKNRFQGIDSARDRICKRLRSPGIDSASLCIPGGTVQ